MKEDPDRPGYIEDELTLLFFGMVQWFFSLEEGELQ